MPRYAILEGPSILGLKPTGAEILPEALLGHGLATREDRAPLVRDADAVAFAFRDEEEQV